MWEGMDEVESALGIVAHHQAKKCHEAHKILKSESKRTPPVAEAGYCPSNG
jgi:hypothetical protein